MENKNNIIDHKIIYLPNSLIDPPLKHKYNLFEDFNIIHYNGITMPRISLFNPLFINSFIPPIINTDINTNLNKYKDSIERHPEIIIPIKENQNAALKIENESIKNTDNLELNKKEENKYINKDKNNLIIKYSDFRNKIANINEKKELIFNKNENPNHKIIKTINNINNINNNVVINTKNNNQINFNNLSILSNETKFASNEKNSNLISPSINSSSSTTKKAKNLFIINEIPKNEIKKEKNEIKDQNILIAIKRGRKQKESNNNKNNKKTTVHEATSEDNIHRKIQVHFISFITNFINDIIKTFIKSRDVPTFKKIDYKIKKIVNHKYFQTLKSKSIADIIKMRPSPKMKNHEINVNEDIYNKICNLCPFMYEFLEQNCMILFKEYYYNNKNKNYIINGTQINISDKTKNFNDLIIKNYAHKEKIKLIALNNFFEDDKAFEKIKFKTSHETNNEINHEII